MRKVRETGCLAPSRARHVVDMHERIVDHLAAGEIPKAVEVLRAHYDDLAQRLGELRDQVMRRSAPSPAGSGRS